MRLLNKLLEYVHHGFHQSADSIELIALNTNDDTLRVALDDGVLSVTQSGFEAVNVTLDGMTVADVYSQISAIYPDSSLSGSGSGLSANILIHARRFKDTESGKYVFIISGYQSFLYVVLDMFASSLATARADIDAAIMQLYLDESELNWLDEYGSYFGLPRLFNEHDDDYRNRIITTVIKPKCNNVAMEISLSDRFGQTSSVTDVTGRPTWFDVTTGFNLTGYVPPDLYHNYIVDFINSIKAAGTKLNALSLTASGVFDSIATANLGDTLTLKFVEEHYFDGKFKFDGSIKFSPNVLSTEVL